MYTYFYPTNSEQLCILESIAKGIVIKFFVAIITKLSTVINFYGAFVRNNA